MTLRGTSFDPADMVTLQCVDAMGNPVVMPNVVAAAPSCASSCTQQITIDGSTLAAGAVCIVRVKNPDGSYGEYSALGVTTLALNLNAPHAGPAMNVGRRALSGASGDAAPAARFVYALGGDNGTAIGALNSTELAPVSIFGKIGAWTQQKQPLNAPPHHHRAKRPADRGGRMDDGRAAVCDRALAARRLGGDERDLDHDHRP